MSIGRYQAAMNSCLTRLVSRHLGGQIGPPLLRIILQGLYLHLDVCQTLSLCGLPSVPDDIPQDAIVTQVISSISGTERGEVLGVFSVSSGPTLDPVT